MQNWIIMAQNSKGQNLRQWLADHAPEGGNTP